MRVLRDYGSIRSTVKVKMWDYYFPILLPVRSSFGHAAGGGAGAASPQAGGDGAPEQGRRTVLWTSYVPRHYAVPGRLVGLSALKTNAAAAPPSSSATM